MVLIDFKLGLDTEDVEKVPKCDPFAALARFHFRMLSYTCLSYNCVMHFYQVLITCESSFRDFIAILSGY